MFENNPDNNLGAADLASGTIRTGLKSRALIRFDLAGQIPANATITSVDLTLRVTRIPPTLVPSTFGLHRLLRNWTEGSKVGPQGGPASTGETTWKARASPGTLWNAPGAAAAVDYRGTASAWRSVAGFGSYVFGSTPEMVADVQSWLANPDSNFGWILISQSEQQPFTARRFASRENANGAPSLNVEFTAPPPARAPDISIDDVSIVEGNFGTTNALFAVNLSEASDHTVRVDYATSDGTATVGALDYVGKTGTLIFTPGETNTNIAIPVNGDSLWETNETFFVTLSNPINATLGRSQALGTIVNDDPLPAISADDPRGFEGGSGSTNLTFTVTLSRPSSVLIRVDFATSDLTAKAGSDYISTNGTVVFNPTETRKSLAVQVIGDNAKEDDEKFIVTFSNPENATLALNQVIGTILNDDPFSVISIGDVSVLEGDGGTVNAVFSVSLSAPSSLAVKVDFTTADGSATSGSDYVAATGTLLFNPGETLKPIAVQIKGDTLKEADENFFVNLTNAVNASIGKGQATGVILDDDPVPTISIADLALTEGNSGANNAVFTVSLSSPSAQTVAVNFSTADGTATSGQDYTASSGTLIFLPGETRKTISIQVNGDTVPEPDERFFVNLSNPINSTLSKSAGIGTIIDDDPPPPPSNASPTISSIANLTMNANSVSSAIAFIVGDQETPTGDLRVVAATSNADLLPVRNVVFAGSGGNRTVTLTPSPDQSGAASVTLTVFDADGGSASTTFLLTVSPVPRVPVLIWTNPSDIVYGTPLSSVQLNAMIDQTGVIAVYSPPAGAVLLPGAGQPLSVAFKDSGGVVVAAKTVTINVLKAPLVVTANDKTRVYGTANPAFDATFTGLVNGDSISNAAAPVVFVTNASETSPVGFYPIVPTGALSSKYEIRFVPGVLTITKATPAVRWETPAGITAGTALSSAQLSASSSVAGTFTYTPTAGTILPVGNAQKLECFFVPADRQNYEPVVLAVRIDVRPIAQPPSKPVQGDFDFDGESDLILQDDDGYLGVWFMNGTTLKSAAFLFPNNVGDKDYRIVGIADFNSDGQDDLLFQHDDGTLGVWLMNGSSLAESHLLQPSNPGDRDWRVAGAGDFNQDGQPDLVFQHSDGTVAVWFLNGLSLRSAALFNPNRPSERNWRVSGVADFNGDGKLDLLFQHVDGSLGLWLLDGMKLIEAAALNPSKPGDDGWRVVSAADRNRDGKPDLLFQHEKNGTLALWLMDGVRLTSGQYLNPEKPGGSWRITGP